MKLKNHLKISIKTFFSQGPLSLLIFCIMPLLLTFVFSFLNGDFVHNLQEIPTVAIQVKDDDQTNLSKELTSLFATEPFELVEKEADYIIEIEKGFKAKIENKTAVSINVVEVKETTNVRETLVFSALAHYNEIISESIFVNSNEQIENKEDFIIQTMLLKVQDSIQKDYLKEEQVRNSFDSAAIMVSGFVFFSILYNLGASHYMQTMGLKQRVHSLPVTKTQNLNVDIVEGFVYSLILFSSSILAFAVFSAEIRMHLLYYIPVVLIESLLATLCSMLISHFLPKMMGTIIMTGIMVVDIIVSNVNIPALEFLMEISPGKVVNQLFEAGYNGALEAILRMGAISILTGGVIYLLLCLKMKWEWGKQS